MITLHRDRPDLHALASTLGQLDLHGHRPFWPVLYPGPPPHASHLPFPTSLLLGPPAPAAEVSAAGLDRAEHPLLGAVTELADQDQVVLSGRLSMARYGWLTGHRVQDPVVLPATGFIEMVLRAGDYVDCSVIEELVLHSPLILASDAATDLQLSVHHAEGIGKRSFTVHSRIADEHTWVPWTLHASGVLSADQRAVPVLSLMASTEAIDEDHFYDSLAEQGFGYSGPFRSLRRIGADCDRPDVGCMPRWSFRGHRYQRVRDPSGLA